MALGDVREYWGIDRRGEGMDVTDNKSKKNTTAEIPAYPPPFTAGGWLHKAKASTDPEASFQNGRMGGVWRLLFKFFCLKSKPKEMH